MKTMVVLTLIYLPTTVVSSILVMPLYDWNAKGGALVNPRISLYVVLAVPPTVLSITMWYLRLRLRRPIPWPKLQKMI